jgi:hypothetical protein
MNEILLYKIFIKFLKLYIYTNKYLLNIDYLLSTVTYKNNVVMQ